MKSGAVLTMDAGSDERRTVTIFADDADHRATIALLKASYRSTRNWAGGGRSANIIALGGGARHALEAAAASSDLVERLVLLSPELVDAALLARVSTPTLVVAGLNDEAGIAAGRRCAEEMPSCYLMLVYEAGADLAEDRPEATRALLEEFLGKGETFPVRTDSNLIHP